MNKITVLSIIQRYLNILSSNIFLSEKFLDTDFGTYRLPYKFPIKNVGLLFSVAKSFELVPDDFEFNADTLQGLSKENISSLKEYFFNELSSTIDCDPVYNSVSYNFIEFLTENDANADLNIKFNALKTEITKIYPYLSKDRLNYLIIYPNYTPDDALVVYEEFIADLANHLEMSLDGAQIKILGADLVTDYTSDVYRRKCQFKNSIDLEGLLLKNNITDLRVLFIGGFNFEIFKQFTLGVSDKYFESCVKSKIEGKASNLYLLAYMVLKHHLKVVFESNHLEILFLNHCRQLFACEWMSPLERYKYFKGLHGKWVGCSDYNKIYPMGIVYLKVNSLSREIKAVPMRSILTGDSIESQILTVTPQRMMIDDSIKTIDVFEYFKPLEALMEETLNIKNPYKAENIKKLTQSQIKNYRSLFPEFVNNFVSFLYRLQSLAIRLITKRPVSYKEIILFENNGEVYFTALALDDDFFKVVFTPEFFPNLDTRLELTISSSQILPLNLYTHLDIEKYLGKNEDFMKFMEDNCIDFPDLNIYDLDAIVNCNDSTFKTLMAQNHQREALRTIQSSANIAETLFNLYLQSDPTVLKRLMYDPSGDVTYIDYTSHM